MCVRVTDVPSSPHLCRLNAELSGKINAAEFKEAFDVVFAKRRTKQKSEMPSLSSLFSLFSSLSLVCWLSGSSNQSCGEDRVCVLLVML